MAMAQMVKPGEAKTFGELADKYYNIMLTSFRHSGCDRVDMVFDRYDNPALIKSGEQV